MQTLPRLRHQLALGLIMMALIPVAGVQAVWSADEGALLYQVDALVDDEGWIFAHPFPAADPTGTYFPIHLSSWAEGSANPSVSNDAPAACAGDTAECRYIVLAKHAAFLWVMAGLYGLGGYALLIVLSVLGGWAAAIATSRLAGLIEPAAEIPALWLSGLASPLFIHSYVAWGHTIAAAMIGWATYGLLAGAPSVARFNKSEIAAPRQRTDNQFHWWRVGALALLVMACLVRTEAPLAVLAIGLALLPRRRRVGAAMIVAGVFGRLVDQFSGISTGGAVESDPGSQGSGFLADRIEAFSITWLRPAYGSDPIDLLVLACAVSVLMAAVISRRTRPPQPLVQALLVAGLLALLLRFGFAQAALIPGLVVAFPVLFAGFLLLDRDMLTEDLLGELIGGFVLFCCAVLATQYRYGGGGEWGGRYFAVGLPLGIAVGTVALVRAARRLDRIQLRRTAGLLTATMVVMSMLGLLGLRTVRQQTEQLAADIAIAADNVANATGDSPVVVSSIPGLGRWMWADVDNGRWLRVPQDDLSATAERLQDLGVDRLAFVSANPDAELPLLAPWFSNVEATDQTRSDSSVFVLEAIDHRPRGATPSP